MIGNEGLRSVYFGFTGRMKAGDVNNKGAVSRSVGQKKPNINNIDKGLTESLELVLELERKERSLKCDITRIGDVIRRRRRKEVTE